MGSRAGAALVGGAARFPGSVRLLRGAAAGTPGRGTDRAARPGARRALPSPPAADPAHGRHRPAACRGRLGRRGHLPRSDCNGPPRVRPAAAGPAEERWHRPRELTRITKASACTPAAVRLILECAHAAGLLAYDGQQWMLATTAYDVWTANELGDVGGVRSPYVVGSSPEPWWSSSARSSTGAPYRPRRPYRGTPVPTCPTARHRTGTRPAQAKPSEGQAPGARQPEIEEYLNGLDRAEHGPGRPVSASSPPGTRCGELFRTPGFGPSRWRTPRW